MKCSFWWPSRLVLFFLALTALLLFLTNSSALNAQTDTPIPTITLMGTCPPPYTGGQCYYATLDARATLAANPTIRAYWTRSASTGTAAALTLAAATATPISGNSIFPTATAVTSNASCPDDPVDPVGLSPNWARVCSHCLAQPTNVISVSTLSVPTLVGVGFAPFTDIPVSTIVSPSLTPSLTPVGVCPAGRQFIIDFNGRADLTWGVVVGFSSEPDSNWMVSGGYAQISAVPDPGLGGSWKTVSGGVYVNVDPAWTISRFEVRHRFDHIGSHGGTATRVILGDDISNLAWSLFTSDFGWYTSTDSATWSGHDRIGLYLSRHSSGVSSWNIDEIRLCVSNWFPSPTPSLTPPSSPTPTRTWQPSFIQHAANCSIPEYVTNTPGQAAPPLIDFAIEPSGSQCYVVFPMIDVDLGASDIRVPEINLCLSFYTVTFSLAGIQFDLEIFIAIGLIVFLIRWLLFH